MAIHIGTSGYAYDDWKTSAAAARGQGTLFSAPGRPPVAGFYPPGTRDQLAYYATRFDTVEINASYYRTPSVQTVRDWARRTPAGFGFWVKLSGEATHRQRGEVAGELDRALEPLREAGKLRGLLAQFPQSFHATPSSIDYVRRVARDYPRDPLVVELRHRSWDRPATYLQLAELGLGVVAVDEPALPELFPSRGVAIEADRVRADSAGRRVAGYLRLHSRAAERWHQGEALRYDYLYTDEELLEWVPWLRQREASGGEVYVYFNNCKRGQAASNAERLRELLLD